MRALLVLCMCLGAWPAGGQPVGPDAAIDRALGSATHARVIDVLSTIGVGVALAAPCILERTWHCLELEGARIGIGLAGTEALKRLGRVRPDGSDDKSFPSAHTMLACVGTVRSRAWALCPGVAIGRIGARKHYATDTAAGAGIGALLLFVHF